MFGKLRSSLRKSLRWKSSRERHAGRSGGDGGDAILGPTSAAASSIPHGSSSSFASARAHHADATPSNSGGGPAAGVTSGSDSAANSNKVPRQWQLDESAVRAGTCAFTVKYLGCAEVFESRGMHVCEQALVLLRDNTVHRKPQRAILYVSGEGLRVVDSKSRNLLVDQTIEKVSFCSPDRNHSKGFAYICRDGTTRRWICHGFNAVADTGERLSHAVGCAFQECLQRKQTREKQLRTKQNNAEALSAANTASNAYPSNTAGTSTASNLKMPSDSAEAPVKSTLLTGNQMNANFQRGTHRTQSLADRRLDPQAFVKVDRPPPLAVGTPSAASPFGVDDTVTVDDLQPQEFRRAQSSRVFSTQFVRQRIRSSMRSGDTLSGGQSNVGRNTATSTPPSTLLNQNNNTDAALDWPVRQQQYAGPSGNEAGAFHNASINFASPVGTEPSSSVRNYFGTTTTINSSLPSAATNNTISSSASAPYLQPSSSSQSVIRNEILDLCARINNQDFSNSSRGLSLMTATMTTPTDRAVELSTLPRSFAPPFASSNGTSWNYVAHSGGEAVGAQFVRTVPIPPRRNILPNVISTTASGFASFPLVNNPGVPNSTVENTQYYHLSKSGHQANGSSSEIKQQQRPNHLPTALLSAATRQQSGRLSKQSSVVMEEDEDPFSPPGWVDKKSVFPPFPPSSPTSAIPAPTPSKIERDKSDDAAAFYDDRDELQQRSPAVGRAAVPFNQLREEDANGSTPARRNPTPAEPTANGTVIHGDYVPVEYFSGRHSQHQFRYRPAQQAQPITAAAQESDPFNTTWVKLDSD